MLEFRRIRIVFLITFLTSIVAGFYYPLFFLLAALLIVGFISLIAWGSYSISSGYFVKAICRSPEKEKSLAITFDDGPHSSVTPKLLELLDRHKVNATFFCIGKNIEGREGLLKDIVAKGHIVGNHSFSHVNHLAFFSWKKLAEDLKKTEMLITKVTGLKPLLFRPPFGVTSPRYTKALEGLKYQVIGWNIRSLDTVEKDPEKILGRVIKQIEGGDIVLFHDTNDRILEVVERLLNHLQKNGIKVVPLDQLLTIKAYENS